MDAPSDDDVFTTVAQKRQRTGAANRSSAEKFEELCQRFAAEAGRRYVIAHPVAARHQPHDGFTAARPGISIDSGGRWSYDWPSTTIDKRGQALSSPTPGQSIPVDDPFKFFAIRGDYVACCPMGELERARARLAGRPPGSTTQLQCQLESAWFSWMEWT